MVITDNFWKGRIAMKKLLPFLIAAVMFSFGSCAPIELNPEALYEPPKLSQEHREIYAAIEDKVGKDYILKYPESGEFRSAIVLRDIDLDNADEAIVFYGRQDGETVRIIVLDKLNGQWKVTCDAAGYGTDIQQVVFEDISGSRKPSIIVGFSQQNVTGNTMIVYEYKDSNLELEYIRDYSEFAVVDIDMDGTRDILVINNNYASNSAYARVLKKNDGSISEVGECYMNEDVVGYLNIKAGIMATGSTAVYIDSLLASGSLMTEVLTVEYGDLVNKVYGMDNMLVEKTIRDRTLAFQDINDDGIFEIPTREPLADSEGVYLTQWQQLYGASLVPVLKTIDNNDAGYRIEIPARWEGDIMVKNVIENNEWIFATTGLKTNGVSYEVLSIRVYSDDDVIDQFAVKNYTLYAEKGMFKYYVSIPELDNELAITEEEFKDMFKLIN